MRSIVKAQAQAQALSLKNSLIMDSYRVVEEKLRNMSALRHELSHQITALDAMYQTGDLPGLGRCLDELKNRSAQMAQVRFTDHFACNAILMDAASRAAEAGIRFETQAPLPEELPIPVEDLCTLLMNMLDNALEACTQVPDRKSRFIAFHAECKNGFWQFAARTRIPACCRKIIKAAFSRPSRIPKRTGLACHRWRRLRTSIKAFWISAIQRTHLSSKPH